MSRVPASPSLSPGRRVLCTVPQSPALGFRAPCAVLAPSTAAALAARHTKSTSDLGQARRSRYDPTRLALGPQSAVLGAGGPPHTRGPSPLGKARPTSPRAELHAAAAPAAAGSRPYTPDAPWGPASSRSGRATPPPQRRPARSSGGGASWAAAVAQPAAAKGGGARAAAPGAGAPAVASSASLQSLPAGQVPPEAPQQLAVGLTTRTWALQPAQPARASPRMQSAGAGAFPAVRSGSRQRSCSQGSQDLRPEAHSAQVPAGHLLAAGSLHGARPKGSPRAQSTRRTSSHLHLECAAPPAASSARATVSTAASAVVPQDGHEVAHMAHVRDSLLQHIQCVQKEITRLQAEREQSQRGAYGSSQSLCSPYLSSRGLLTPVEVCSSPSERALERGLRRPQDAPAQAAGPRGAKRASGSARAPAPAPGPEEAPRGAGPPAAAPAGSASAAKIQRAWRRWLVGARRAREAAARPPPPRGSPAAPRRAAARCFAAYNHAAARIQRAWRVSRWRRVFVGFSEREVGWVGSLDWLQAHNQLYGTELADEEDDRRWQHRRAGAPLDREIDPWGCVKLRDHLHKMWYGRSTEELEAATRELESEQWLREGGGMKRCLASQEVLLLYEQPRRGAHRQGHSALYSSDAHAHSAVGLSASLRSPLATERAAGPRASVGLAAPSGGHKALSLSPRREASWARDGHGRGRTVALAALPAAPSLQSPPQTHRATRAAAGAPQAAVAGAAAAFRPRSPVQAQHRSLQGGAAWSSGRLSLPAAGVAAARMQAAPGQRGSAPLVPGSPLALSSRHPHQAAPITCKG